MSIRKHNIMVTNGVSTWAETKGLLWVYELVFAAHLTVPYRLTLVCRLYPDHMEVLDDDLVVQLNIPYNPKTVLPVESEVGYVEVWFMNNTLLFPHEY